MDWLVLNYFEREFCLSRDLAAFAKNKKEPKIRASLLLKNGIVIISLRNDHLDYL